MVLFINKFIPLNCHNIWGDWYDLTKNFGMEYFLFIINLLEIIPV